MNQVRQELRQEVKGTEAGSLPALILSFSLHFITLFLAAVPFCFQWGGEAHVN